MNFFINVLEILIFVILAASLIYTIVIGRRQKAAEGEMDSQIAGRLQEHSYMKNPVFLAYGIFFALLLFIVLFVFITFF